MWRTGLVVAIVLILAVPEGWAGGGLRCVLSQADEKAEASIVKSFRERGPAGLSAALDEYDKAYDPRNPDSAFILRCSHAIDLIAGQRHATVSRLYWYTDFEAAKAAAAESGKPILSLRMLGNLTDEFSCANSRFFRTALYANKEISNTMREQFVLHWQSVRPVPKVTIDFGDGRKLERTITGNSAHYVLNATGRPLDVLPGLYSPKAFQAWLVRSQELHSNYVNSKQVNDAVLVGYHTKRFQLVSSAYNQDQLKVGIKSPLRNQRGTVVTKAKKANPPAKEAAKFAIGKTVVEAPLLKVVTDDLQPISDRLDNQAWMKIAALHRQETRLDESSRRLMRSAMPTAQQAGEIAFAKSEVAAEDPLLKVIRNFENAIALDTVRNEYLLHRQIHRWFAEGQATSDIDALNERVYSELFLTPSSDPWLGLVPTNSYTALNNEGLSEPVTRISSLGLAEQPE